MPLAPFTTVTIKGLFIKGHALSNALEPSLLHAAATVRLSRCPHPRPWFIVHIL